MLDIKFVRENKKEVETALLKRMEKKNLDLDKILKLDDQRREILAKLEDLQAQRNKASKTKPDAETIKQMKALGTDIKKLETELKKVELEYNEKLSALPNIPHDDVVAGGKENNKISNTYGEQPKFDFKAKDHVELATTLGLIDYKRAAKMSGAGFWAYTGDGALLEWALLNYFIDFHRSHPEYSFMIPPYMLNEQSAFISGHLPKFKEDLFWTEDDKLCLNATSEMMLGNYHAGEILDEKDLPKKYYAFSTCFRREAGAYRTEERGMIRGHQFNKIEMFHFTKPENSWTAFDELLAYAEDLVKGLDLHFNTVQLAAGDCSAAMAKTVDIEVWIPSMKVYKEVSSVSNALDYQARRGNVRFKGADGNNFVHTLNASGLATSRVFPAILEQYQQADGTVAIPEVLQKYMAGKKFLTK
ncbi:serine--tRNA ligase [Candidatus Parcubacteria bacterium]|jgi:seryl-tRNA synthetase|nr:serine--tRNA ligase [Candidatus Parcubacteria bacterium]MBT7228076.1 serine--tRNA ligase [Candidatus Parcubacteria bacterium]